MSQKKKKKEALVAVNNPKAAVLDYRQLRITIQSESKSISHRLPHPSDISTVFCRYGECEVECLGKSNQYLIKYNTPNSGCVAYKTLSIDNKATHSLINNAWNISSIKYQWNSYCSSIFYSNKSSLSICAKGSKCGKMHQLVNNDQAFVPIGNQTADNLSFEKLKQLRWRLYREHDTIQDIEDWNNIEGITLHNKVADEHANEAQCGSATDSTSSSSSLSSKKIISSRRQRMDLKKKELLSGILRTQVKAGNANWKCLSYRNAQKSAKKEKKKRKSPPLQPQPQPNKDENEHKSEEDAVSVASHRSARSTVYVSKPDINETTSSSSDSESSSSRSGLFNTKVNDWNALNEKPNKQKAKKKKHKNKSDAIAMRYLNKKKNPKKARDKKTISMAPRSPPCTPSPSPPPPSKIESECIAIASAEKTAYTAVRSVLGSNEVPIIKANKNTVSYLQSKRQQNNQKQNTAFRTYRSQNNQTQNRIGRNIMNPMQNTMMQPMNNINSMNNMNALINAPPFFPTAFPNAMTQQPRVPMSNFMNSMNVSGSILAGTFKTNTPQQTMYNPPQQTMYSQPPPIYNQPFSTLNNPNQHNQNHNNQTQPNQHQANLSNANHMKSIPTTSLKRKPLRKQPKIMDYSDPKYEYVHSTTLTSPSTIEDYHWLCFHFRSGDKYSCTYGSDCRWRHFDFEMRADIKTAWNPQKPILKYKPRIPQLAEARILRKSMEKKFKWLADKKYSNNPFIVENNTPPSMKKIRVENHRRNKQIIDEKDAVRKKLVIEEKEEMLIEQKKEATEEKDTEKDAIHKMLIDAEKEVIHNAEDKDDVVMDYSIDKIECVLRDYDTAMSMMTPFCQEKNPNVNYHLIGYLAYQQFAALRKIICELKKE